MQFTSRKMALVHRRRGWRQVNLDYCRPLGSGVLGKSFNDRDQYLDLSHQYVTVARWRSAEVTHLQWLYRIESRLFPKRRFDAATFQNEPITPVG